MSTTNDTDHPDARSEAPPGKRTRGTFALPMAYGPDLQLTWLLTQGDDPRVIVYPEEAAPVTVHLDLGRRALVAATLRALAHDLESAPAWSATARIVPEAA